LKLSDMKDIEEDITLVPKKSDYSSTKSLEEMVALVFMSAAIVDTTGALFSDSFEISSNVLSNIANHLYLLEAILAICGHKCYNFAYDDNSSSSSGSFDNKIYSLKQLGDFLFLLGSLIDVITGYCFMMPRYEASITLNVWGLVSDVLWLLDPLLYITADIIQNNKSKSR